MITLSGGAGGMVIYPETLLSRSWDAGGGGGARRILQVGGGGVCFSLRIGASRNELKLTDIIFYLLMNISRKLLI